MVKELSGVATDQIVAGWRAMNSRGTLGVRLYTPPEEGTGAWRVREISGEAVAIEDMKSADVDGIHPPNPIYQTEGSWMKVAG